MSEWEDCRTGNCVLKGDGFYISFNPAPGGGFALFASDNGGAETALVKNDQFMILNGDYRDDYQRLVAKGFDACKQFYDEHKTEDGSSWSSEETA